MSILHSTYLNRSKTQLKEFPNNFVILSKTSCILHLSIPYLIQLIFVIPFHFLVKKTFLCQSVEILRHILQS